MLDQRDYPSGPNGLAQLCADKMADLLAERETADRDRRKAINKHLHLLRDVLNFSRSRQGYSAAGGG